MGGLYFTDEAIANLQSKVVDFCKTREKGLPYEKFINWRRKENEIMVYTLYAYADLAVPKSFDIIFRLDNPKEFVQVDYVLTQSIFEACYPYDMIDNGHKHLCVFSFEKALPDILKTMFKDDCRLSVMPKDQEFLGFCRSENFDAITETIEKRIALKKRYGKDWVYYDDEE